MYEWKEFKAPDYCTRQRTVKQKRKKVKKDYADVIITLDIETSTWFYDRGHQYGTDHYISHKYDKKNNIDLHACMYIWMVGINDTVYYGRTHAELSSFLDMINEAIPEDKIIWIHNLSYEFHFLMHTINFTDVFARNTHKPMTARDADRNIEYRCSYMLSGVRLELLPKIYTLDTQKLTGDLDYRLIRTPATPLTEQEMKYCENDCLVLYEYICTERNRYDGLYNIPKTNTGKVRLLLREKVKDDEDYKRKISRACDTNGNVYNMLLDAFMGGYTHSNWFYTKEVISSKIDSWDFTSSYPYVLCCFPYPSNKFQKCYHPEYIYSEDCLSSRYAYLLDVTFYDLRCRYDNHFISESKVKDISGGYIDNGRIVKADEVRIVLTDVDFRFILKAYGSGKQGKEQLRFNVNEAYFSKYNYLPKQLVEFILDMYVKKTEYKNVQGMESEYQLVKGQFNSIYGMCVTNDIRADVKYENGNWYTVDMSDQQILTKLRKKEREGFLAFSTGVWCTAWARTNLLYNVIKCDEHVVYCDTDSMKLLQGYDRSIIDNYNTKVYDLIKRSSAHYGIPVNRYQPEDIKCIKHPLGVFDNDDSYDSFVTYGAKKYAYTHNGHINITVSGVPKQGAKCLNSLADFKEGLVFDPELTGKLTHVYLDDQSPVYVTDYQGNRTLITDKSGIALIPCEYILGVTEDYDEFLSTERARYNGN